MINRPKHISAILLAASLAVSPAFGISLPAWLTPQQNHSVPRPPIRVAPQVLNLQNSFAEVADRVRPAVVSIATERRTRAPEMPEFPFQEFRFGDPFDEFFGRMKPRQEEPRLAPRSDRVEGMGSGVIIDSKGFILTNEHVVDDAQTIKVMLYDERGRKTEYTGRVVGKDSFSDLAVVRIHALHTLPTVPLGDSDKIRIGDWVMAVGSPFGLEQTVTAGIVSAKRQSVSVEGKTYQGFLQTDAAINPGNSGGPLVNLYGQMIGINTAIYAPTGVFSGVGFAIPVNQAKRILDQLIRGGHVVRGWLGIEMAPEISPAMVHAFHLPDDRGALVNEVLKDSPASRAGLKRGDIIRSFDGKSIGTPEDLQRLVAAQAPKSAVPLEIVRNGERLTLRLTLGERPASADANTENAEQPSAEIEGKTESWQGAEVSPITPVLAQQYQVADDAHGVVVTDVKDGSVADQLGLMPGDVIRAVDETQTPDLNAFKRATRAADPQRGIVLDILRQGHPLYLSYSGTP